MQDSVWARRIHEPFVAAALGVALTAGFGYAALLAGALALRVPLDAWWGATVQAHGHAQLFGWMGLFIFGMGLYFLPKLRGARLQATRLAPLGLGLLVVGLALHSFVQPALGLLDPASRWSGLLRGYWAASVLIELAGMLVLAQMLVTTLRAAGPLSREAPAYPIMPFLTVAAASIVLAFVFNASGVLLAVFAGSAVVAPAYDSLVIQLMLYGLALPVAFVFSVRNLPLFLRLAMPPREELRYLASFYTLGLVLRILPNLVGIADHPASLFDQFCAVGVLVQSAVILIFIWRLDLLRRHPPWTVNRAPNTRPDLEYLRKPTRKNYPDAGEYGRFELLVYSAYTWLAVAVLFGIARSAGILFGNGGVLPLDAERHALTVGFVTLLIFGMAARMLPGFSGKRRVARPDLVFVTFLLGNLAALLRVVPLFLPTSPVAMTLFGLSGAVGWLAVAVLTVNVARTFRLEK